jgi:hypothetical protein
MGCSTTLASQLLGHSSRLVAGQLPHPDAESQAWCSILRTSQPCLVPRWGGIASQQPHKRKPLPAGANIGLIKVSSAKSRISSSNNEAGYNDWSMQGVPIRPFRSCKLGQLWLSVMKKLVMNNRLLPGRPGELLVALKNHYLSSPRSRFWLCQLLLVLLRHAPSAGTEWS